MWSGISQKPDGSIRDNVSMYVFTTLAGQDIEAIDRVNAMIEVALQDYEADLRKKYQSAFPGYMTFNIDSPAQLGTLFYDILGIKPKVDYKTKEEKRSTSVDVMEEYISDKVGDNGELVSNILRYREISKLVSGFLEALPEKINPATGMIHGQFNQLGTATGRFSSNNPNVQQVPSGDTTIRNCFGPTKKGYVLISSDLSSIEPRLASHMSQDPNLIGAFVNKRDVYATIISKSLGYKYEDCLEKHPDGTLNPDGKKKRGIGKVLLLAKMYGMSSVSVGRMLNMSTEAAQKVSDDFMREFPQLKASVDNAVEEAKMLKRVKLINGRFRHFPRIDIPPLAIKAGSQLDIIAKKAERLYGQVN